MTDMLFGKADVVDNDDFTCVTFGSSDVDCTYESNIGVTFGVCSGVTCVDSDVLTCVDSDVFTLENSIDDVGNIGNHASKCIVREIIPFCSRIKC